MLKLSRNSTTAINQIKSEDPVMQTSTRLSRYFLGAVAPIVLGALSTSAANAACSGPGAPTTTQTKCLTAIAIPGNPIRSFDISWVNPDRAEYYLGDRSNKGIDIIDTQSLTFKRTIFGFVGIVLKGTGVDNAHSGPDGVASHGRWLYAGDGDSTLKVIDLNTSPPIKQTISTGGTTRLDELALTSDGTVLIAANNAEDPPFATLFRANGDAPSSNVFKTGKIVVQSSVVPAGFGLSLEQPTYDPTTKRFFTSIPVIAENPPGCNYGQLASAITCDGGVLVTNPVAPDLAPGLFNPATNNGVVKLHACGPNGATVGPNDAILLGCTPANNPSNTTSLVINGTTKNQTNIGGITGSDEVWYNSGDYRYYTASSRAIGGPALGVIDATSILLETIPQSSGSHSVAADSKRNLIFVPQVGTVGVVGSGGDTTPTQNGAGICGTSNGCVAVYRHDVDHDHDHDGDHDREHEASLH
jgi:hypothetical protein